LDFFGRIGTYQWVTGEKIKKFVPRSARVEGCARNVSNRIPSLALANRLRGVGLPSTKRYTTDSGFWKEIA
jgi:hypothetical protein